MEGITKPTQDYILHEVHVKKSHYVGVEILSSYCELLDLCV